MSYQMIQQITNPGKELGEMAAIYDNHLIYKPVLQLQLNSLQARDIEQCPCGTN